MAQQDTRTEAVPQEFRTQTHFLRHTDSDGYQSPNAPMGHHKMVHSVLCFTEKPIADFHVALSIQAVGFGLQEYLTPEEARTLAAALLMAASHAEDQDNERRAADWLASQQQQAAEVPA